MSEFFFRGGLKEPHMDEKPPFAVQAAKASWLAPLIAIGLSIVGNIVLTSDPKTDEATIRTGKIVIGFSAFAIVIVGLVFGVLALLGIKRHGAKGILVPAFVGILLSSGYLYLVV